MLMHVYRLNFLTNNIDKYNQGQGRSMERIFNNISNVSIKINNLLTEIIKMTACFVVKTTNDGNNNFYTFEMNAL